MIVTGVKCARCKEIIYSRARHDFHYCSCGGTYVDGGFEYLKFGHEMDMATPDIIQVDVEADRGGLYDDWNHSVDKYGTIKAEGDVLPQGPVE